LSPRFAESVRNWLSSDEHETWQDSFFSTSRPPHKHRYQYAAAIPALSTTEDHENANPLALVLHELLPSLAFRKWLALATGLSLKRCSVIARRFRRGLDYQLAQGYEGEEPQLEYCLCITPTSGWGAEDDALESNGNSNGKSKAAESGEEDNVGGYELYMAGDDPEDDKEGSDDGVEIPAKVQSHTGAGDRRSAKRKKADPAVYQAAADDEDDGILVSNPASWNTLNIVLRDQGTLKFVKYVSKRAPGDRYDFAGAVEVEPDDEEDEEE
jgi:prolyl 3-hydroxylase /prolyl 3,4-dihydroxylase